MTTRVGDTFVIQDSLEIEQKTGSQPFPLQGKTTNGTISCLADENGESQLVYKNNTTSNFYLTKKVYGVISFYKNPADSNTWVTVVNPGVQATWYPISNFDTFQRYETNTQPGYIDIYYTGTYHIYAFAEGVAVGTEKSLMELGYYVNGDPINKVAFVEGVGTNTDVTMSGSDNWIAELTDGDQVGLKIRSLVGSNTVNIKLLAAKLMVIKM